MERLRETFAIQVRYVHFPLHPETPEEGLTLEQLFAGRGIDIRAAKDRMVRLMAAEELPYGERSMTFNSRLAQELAKWAEAHRDAEGIHDALFRAYFVDGRNIGQMETLVDIAGQLGLDGREATEVLTSRRFKDAVDADWQRCRSLGITGVPSFVLGDAISVGAQPYEVLERWLRESGIPSR